MALMTVNNEETGDFRSKPRWSANKKLDAVMRLLRGEKLEELSRELGVEAHRLAGRVHRRWQGWVEGKDYRRWRTRRSSAPSGRTQDRRADHGQRDPAGHR